MREVGEESPVQHSVALPEMGTKKMFEIAWFKRSRESQAKMLRVHMCVSEHILGVRQCVVL